VARWWKPDAVVFVESVPLGTTGKVLKHRLREQYADYYLSA
jgi:3-(methylthio)propionyl---CoA ligase